jgi:hypothetical protein
VLAIEFTDVLTVAIPDALTSISPAPIIAALRNTFVPVIP